MNNKLSIRDFFWVLFAFVRGKLLRQKAYRPKPWGGNSSIIFGMQGANFCRLSLLMKWWGLRPMTQQELHTYLNPPPKKVYTFSPRRWNDLLPARLKGCNTKAILEAAGVKFLGTFVNDDIFENVVLPNGWYLEETRDPLHWNLFDNRGRVRGTMCYKSAIWDNRADLWLENFFRVDMETKQAGGEVTFVAKVKTAGNDVVFTTEPVTTACNVDSPEYDEIYERIRGLGFTWLDLNCPNWRNPDAYWD